jgi:hypothetical protein
MDLQFLGTHSFEWCSVDEERLVPKSQSFVKKGIARKTRRGVQLRLLPVLLVSDLFHPFNHLAVEIFLDGDMRHGGGRTRAVPMLLARRKPDHITGMYLFDRTTVALRPPAAGCDD